MKIITTPNIITSLRLVLSPIIVYALLAQKQVLTLILFSIAVLTDFLDGFIARKYKLESNSGKVLDALSDTILIISIAATLFLTNYLKLYELILLVIPRPISYVLIRIKHKKKFFTSKYAKTAAVFSYTFIILLILNVKLIVWMWLSFILFSSLLHWLYILRLKK